MLIEEYFVHLERTFASCLYIAQTTLTKEKRALHIGFIKGTATFTLGIQLFLMEFVRAAGRGERIIPGKPPTIEAILSEITEFIEQSR